MPMGSNRLKFSSYPRKRQAGFKSVNNPSDSAILSMSVDSKSLFRRSAQRLLPPTENKHNDGVFQALLSEANRELASLLRDVCAQSAVPRSSTCCKQNWAILPSPTNSQACTTVAVLWPWQNGN